MDKKDLDKLKKGDKLIRVLSGGRGTEVFRFEKSTPKTIIIISDRGTSFTAREWTSSGFGVSFKDLFTCKIDALKSAKNRLDVQIKKLTIETNLLVGFYNECENKIQELKKENK